MPIKLPKGFARRKSSGNALEEVENPPQSSFRVFERPSGDKKSFGDGNLVSKRLSEGQPLYSPSEDDNNIFAAHKSQPPKNLNFYEGTPSARVRPSTRQSADGPSQPELQSPHTRNLYDIPIPPLSGAIRAAGRTFSFGGRFSKAPVPTPPPQPSTPGPSRSRAMTTSTSSTATPPRLPETQLQIGKIEDDFQNMFGDFENRHGVQKDLSSQNKPGSPGPSTRPDAFTRKEDKISRPSPIDTDRSREVEPSPYSWDSRHSEEGLLTTLDSPIEQLGAGPDHRDTNTISIGERRKSSALSNAVPLATTSHRSLAKPRTVADGGLRRSGIYSSKRDSEPIEDEDAKLIRDSVYSTQRSSQAVFASDQEGSDAENDAPLFGHGDTNVFHTHHHRKSQPKESLNSPTLSDHHLDFSIAAHARLAEQYEKAQPVPAPFSNKVMTPSQFEHYRQQQELRRSNSHASKSENSAESDYEEEDEVEKDREADRQRRKQEAHLSVYRQQMMKVTGQDSPAPALRPAMDRASKSAPNLLHPGNISGSGKSSDGDGDEDEEIPLGILAAHGFPNRNRPPTRLTPSNSIPNLRASFQQPYVSSPGSVAEHDVNNRGSLPVFARNLPRDPYFGASLVNPSNRESLALGGGASVHGGPSPALPPGGLVGVIATEERARAMRRGSPNTQAMYDFQAGMSVPPAHPGGVPRPYTMMNLSSANTAGMQPTVSATEQAQIQLSQQMTQMVQMQMQWMQQMIQIQGGQSNQLMLPGGTPPTLNANVNVRPSSMPSAGNINNAPGVYQSDQRTLSMLDPNASSRLNSTAMPYASGGLRPSTPAGKGYAPSIAPSERSNVGLAPRYRPVSTMQPEFGSTNASFMSKPWNDENPRSSVSVTTPAGSHMSRAAIHPVTSDSRPVDTGKPNTGTEPDDEDDDEGWAEMMKKREDKRNNWKMKKETSSFGDLLNAVH
ncbi:hypothetical protein BO70DRAFT_302942 [Aspergillus heteromorphus CBS 117.55]|uniref:Uncharacterized protein n=1 Tax=Aspergillus heteromorphus CBS 117.55 TaxID=1448321 RepID=A0A317US50_9EURO|nr:uncharacterized protein BO70DRAFT_302942 [Aspergillus heteromorphus CBS 117.55]PWY64481.1 hypothetical protein BO70DRAFT_302942 [Aspergillus heteromorphus CBS 117.55]